MRNKGFTLIELIVAMAAFSLIVVAMTGMAFSMIKAQRKSFAIQNTQEAGRFIMESINKELRMSSIDSGDSGGNPINLLNITNPASEIFSYQFDNTNRRLLRNGEFMSSDNLDVTGNFYITKTSFPSRSLVTIVMQIKSSTGHPDTGSEIYLQSTVSSRGY